MSAITRRIAAAIRANDLPAYQRERYPAIPDGEIVWFVNEDFSGVDFDQFVMGFFAFENCNLDYAKHIYGQPIYFTIRRFGMWIFAVSKLLLRQRIATFAV